MTYKECIEKIMSYGYSKHEAEAMIDIARMNMEMFALQSALNKDERGN